MAHVSLLDSHLLGLKSPSISYYYWSTAHDEVFADPKACTFDWESGYLVYLVVLDRGAEGLGHPAIVVIEDLA